MHASSGITPWPNASPPGSGANGCRAMPPWPAGPPSGNARRPRPVLAQVERTLAKARFWQRFGSAGLLPEQVKVLNRLLDGGERGFAHGISASQYQKAVKVSKATATRHLAGLVEKGCLVKLPGGGRSTRYQVPDVLRRE